MPGAEIEAVVAARHGAGGVAEVREVPGRPRDVVLVIAGDRLGDRSHPPPRLVVGAGARVLLEEAVLVLPVSEHQYVREPRLARHQVRGLLVVARDARDGRPRLARDVASRLYHGIAARDDQRRLVEALPR